MQLCCREPWKVSTLKEMYEYNDFLITFFSHSYFHNNEKFL